MTVAVTRALENPAIRDMAPPRAGEWPGMLPRRFSAPQMGEERGDEHRHHRVEVGDAAHDTDVGELGLLLARKMRADALGELGRGRPRLQELDLRDARPRQHRGPAGLRLEILAREPGLLGDLAHDVAREVDAL